MALYENRARGGDPGQLGFPLYLLLLSLPVLPVLWRHETRTGAPMEYIASTSA